MGREMSHRSPTEKPQSAETITETIVSEVAAREGIQPENLARTLYEVVDPDALERLFEPTVRGRRGGRLVFPFNGYTVTVTSDTHVRITTDAETRDDEEPPPTADDRRD